MKNFQTFPLNSAPSRRAAQQTKLKPQAAGVGAMSRHRTRHKTNQTLEKFVIMAAQASGLASPPNPRTLFRLANLVQCLRKVLLHTTQHHGIFRACDASCYYSMPNMRVCPTFNLPVVRGRGYLTAAVFNQTRLLCMTHPRTAHDRHRPAGVDDLTAGDWLLGVVLTPRQELGDCARYTLERAAWTWTEYHSCS